MNTRRLFQNIENQNTSSKRTTPTSKTGCVESAKVPAAKAAPPAVDNSDIEHFKKKGSLRFARKFQLEESSGEYNQDAFMLFDDAFFGLVTRCYDEYENQFDTMLRVYATSDLKSERVKLRLLDECDRLIDCQVISERLVLLVNQSNNRKMLKLLHFTDKSDPNSYEFKVFRFEGERQTLFLHTNEATGAIYILNANCTLHKFDLGLQLVNSLNFQADLRNLHSIFSFSGTQLGLFSKKSARIDILELSADYAELNSSKHINLQQPIDTEFVYFDAKSRMYLFDEETKTVKVHSLLHQQHLFDFSLNYADLGTCITRFFLDKTLQHVFLVDSLNKTFVF